MWTASCTARGELGPIRTYAIKEPLMSDVHNLNEVTQQFRQFVHGKIEPDKVNEITSKLHTFTEEYTVSGAVGGFLFALYLALLQAAATT